MIKLMSLMRRADGMAKEEFVRWARDEHPAFARELPGLRRYLVSVTDADDAPFDSVSEMYFDDERRGRGGVRLRGRQGGGRRRRRPHLRARPAGHHGARAVLSVAAQPTPPVAELGRRLAGRALLRRRGAADRRPPRARHGAPAGARGRARGGQDRDRQGAGARAGPGADPPAVLRGAGRRAGAVRVGLPEAAPARPRRRGRGRAPSATSTTSASCSSGRCCRPCARPPAPCC